MDSLGGVAEKDPFIYLYQRNGWGTFPQKFPPKMKKKQQIKIASAHIHIPRNNPAKFQNYLMDSLRGVTDKGPLYIFISKKWLGGISPPPRKSTQNEKIPKLK